MMRTWPRVPISIKDSFWWPSAVVADTARQRQGKGWAHNTGMQAWAAAAGASMAPDACGQPKKPWHIYSKPMQSPHLWHPLGNAGPGKIAKRAT